MEGLGSLRGARRSSARPRWRTARASAEGASPPAYGKGAEYWNERYKSSSAPFEWLREYSELADVIRQVTSNNTHSTVLNVGCGNSLLPEDMYDRGYTNIVNIDISQVVVEQMIERNRGRPGMLWFHMDARQMSLASQSFDLVIDKSTLDAFMCSGEREADIRMYLREVSRVLRPGGTYLCITYGDPLSRLPAVFQPHLQNWSLKITELPPRSNGSSCHYCYRFTMPPTATT